MTSKMILTTAKITVPDLPTFADENVDAAPLFNSKLQWRNKILWVTPAMESQFWLPALHHEQWLKSCIQRSDIRLVYLNPSLGEADLKRWADVCVQCHKPVFVRVPKLAGLPHCRQQLSWRIKRIADWLAAALLLTLLSPLMGCLALLIQFDSPGPVFFRQWRVGRRGRLFQIYKFRSMISDAEKLHHQVMDNQEGLHKLKQDPRVTRVGKWLRQYSLDELPQLFNVLRGEMSLVGPRPWALYDAMRLPLSLQSRLNALPGITGAWQVEARSNLLDLEAVSHFDIEYLQGWSLFGDIKLLLRTIPKVFVGFGAY